MISNHHSRPGVSLGLLLLLSAAACWQAAGFEQTDVSEYTYPATALRNLSLENRNGRIHLQAWDRREIQLKVTKRVKGWRNEENKGILKEIKVERIHEGETLTIRTVWPNHWSWWGRSASVQYEIKLPRRMNVETTSSNGRVYASGLEGKQRYSTTNGRIQVQGGKGSLEAETVNGAIEIDGASGVLEAQTKNGSIRIQNIRGRLQAKTKNGRVRASFSASPDGEVALNTKNGSVRLTLPSQTHADVVARTANGSIATDFPLTVQGEIGKKLEGQLGGGGPPIRLSTVNGSIRISKLE
ncbi:MAG: DUF4097 family beta strand repeat-containing protein [Acidobacteriota bacterium]|nr:DUF4097 family beta strand repeat-containing protein [Acidobacteriota bacterium]